jgi:hypothetical protein
MGLKVLKVLLLQFLGGLSGRNYMGHTGLPALTWQGPEVRLQLRTARIY